MTAKVVEYGMSKPIRVKLPDVYFDILSTMAHIQGRTVEDLAKERLQQILIEDVQGGLFDGGLYGVLLSEGWNKTLKGDPYFEGVA